MTTAARFLFCLMLMACTGTDAELPQGIPDFSHCGYMGGGVPIPDAPVRVVVPRAEGDNTARIQAAIDDLAALSPDDRGIRGAVLLQKGRYDVNGGLGVDRV